VGGPRGAQARWEPPRRLSDTASDASSRGQSHGERPAGRAPRRPPQRPEGQRPESQSPKASGMHHHPKAVIPILVVWDAPGVTGTTHIAAHGLHHSALVLPPYLIGRTGGGGNTRKSVSKPFASKRLHHCRAPNSSGIGQSSSRTGMAYMVPPGMSRHTSSASLNSFWT
jgi:hypothetical protein